MGVSLYCRFWKIGRPNGFLPCSGTLARNSPSRSMMKRASPLSRSASASQLSSLPFDSQVRRRGRRCGVGQAVSLTYCIQARAIGLVRQPRSLQGITVKLRSRDGFEAGDRSQPRTVGRHGLSGSPLTFGSRALRQASSQGMAK